VKHRVLALVAAACLCGGLFIEGAAADDILTADQYFLQVSDRYAQIKDYEAHIAITAGKNAPMTGTIVYKAPSLLRIDFIQPPDQVISFNGEQLQVYIPSLHAILAQSTQTKSGAGGAALASKEGLKMMRRNYTVAYVTGPNAVALDPNSMEFVVSLVLNRKNVSEGYRTLKLSIDPGTKLIRRIEGWTLSNDYFMFDFTNMKFNQNIADTRFEYDSPASANVYNNFLFGNDNN
jgi:outer membrane lipoprotein-sorting protein